MNTNLPDDELLRRIQMDDRKAFSAIVYRYNVRLYRIVYNRVRLKDDTKDIIQEIFISLWNNRHKIQSAVLFPYLSKSAFYAVIDWQVLNKKNLFRQNILLEKDEPSVSSIENQVMANELGQELMKEIEKMPDTTRAVFRMSRVDQKSVKEIAETLHLSEQTVKNNIAMALKQLRKRMLNHELSLLPFYFLMKLFSIKVSLFSILVLIHISLI